MVLSVSLSRVTLTMRDQRSPLPSQPLKFPFPLTGPSGLQGILAIDREDGEREEGEYSILSDLKSRAGRAKPEFAGTQQQDSHEFLLSLLDLLHEDTRSDYLESNQSIINQLLRLQSVIDTNAGICNM